MSAVEGLGIGWLGVAGMMAVLWFWQRARRDATVVDVGWTLGFGLVALLGAVFGSGEPARRWLVGMVAAVWSLRLGLHLLLSRILGHPQEDGRYRALRTKWGDRAQPYFFVFFQAQALLAALFAGAPMLAMIRPGPFPSFLDLVGLAVGLIAIFGEGLADRQLSGFRTDPANRGRTCRSGLWRYSRHPNYFFEWLHWWAYVLIAAGGPWWGLTLLAPALMLYFLLRVTGIPATEAQALASRGEDYRDYQRTTSAFIPWFPRREE
jgi:steroid 5-alpha reductase family enzyme